MSQLQGHFEYQFHRQRRQQLRMEKIQYHLFVFRRCMHYYYSIFSRTHRIHLRIILKQLTQRSNLYMYLIAKYGCRVKLKGEVSPNNNVDYGG